MPNGIKKKLFAAINDIKKLKKIIDSNEKINLDWMDDYGYTPLCLAAERGNADVVRYLLEKGANPNLTRRKVTPLASAAIDGHIEVVKVLIEYAATQQTVSKNMFMPGLKYQPIPGDGHCLYHAVSLYTNGGDQLLLRHIVSAHLEDNLKEFKKFIGLPKGKTIKKYIQAVREGKEWASHIEIEVLMRVLGRPILIILPDGSIRNAGDLERFKGDPIFVFYNDHNHYDALLLRNNYTTQNILEQLEQFRENLLATQTNKHPRVVNLNLSGDYKAPIGLAAQNYYFDTVKLLVNAGANINGRADNGKTALHFAAEAGDEELVQFLLDQGADINAKDARELTPLQMADSDDQENIITILIERGAKISIRDEENKSVIDYSEEAGQEEKSERYRNAMKIRVIESEPNPVKRANLRFKLNRTDNVTVPTLAVLGLFAVKLNQQKTEMQDIMMLPKELIEKLGETTLNPHLIPLREAIDYADKHLVEDSLIALLDGKDKILDNFLEDTDNVENLLIARTHARNCLNEFITGNNDDISDDFTNLLRVIDEPDYEGNTALHLATKSRCYNAVALLLATGANINVINLRNHKPIDLARRLPFTYALLDFIAAIDNLHDEDRLVKCENLFIEKLDLLDLNEADNEEDENVIFIDLILKSNIILPLHTAILQNIDDEKFEWLIQQECICLTEEDEEGYTALQLAEEEGQINKLRLLRRTNSNTGFKF